MPQAKTRAIEVAEKNARAEKGVQEDNAAGIHSNAVNQYRKRKIARSLEMETANTLRTRGCARAANPLRPEERANKLPATVRASTTRPYFFGRTSATRPLVAGEGEHDQIPCSLGASATRPLTARKGKHDQTPCSPSARVQTNPFRDAAAQAPKTFARSSLPPLDTFFDKDGAKGGVPARPRTKPLFVQFSRQKVFLLCLWSGHF